MLDYEKLGTFYLGKRVDEDSQELSDDEVLYDSKDLTTHAVIIGMTGSGKTGLGIGILEEAAMDNIPVIAIDPKGDLGNLLLTFPDLAPKDFEPWVNARAASDKGQTVAEYAAGQAKLWKNGLADWGQDGERIARMRENVDLAIYTPGSTAGLPVSVLASFAAPPPELIDDADLYGDRIQATATSVLSLLQIDADPVSSREHILISRLLDYAWREGRDLGIADLIAAIQNPPLKKVGVMDVDSFYPAKDRFALAMKLNNLLAAPGFEAWTKGVPLKAKNLLYTESGKPRISVMSIAHLDDSERMFFVAMLLNEIIAWMRAQPGTSSLRAILYMDEIFGFMPPVANPPSKNLLLTMLKQARAYGLGLALATQNPVDLDYRGLSNTGTWMIGRLQTERDKARVMEGLEGVRQGESFDKQAMERTLAGLGKRRFLLHNVHENEPVVFNTRWVMSYLAGPLTRDQIKQLAGPAKALQQTKQPAVVSKPAVTSAVDSAPALPPGVPQFYVRCSAAEPTYFPRLLATTDVAFTNARYKVDEERAQTYAVEFADGPVLVDWDDGEVLELSGDDLQRKPVTDASFAECPAGASESRNYSKWEKALKRWIRQNESITLFRSKTYRMTSEAGETEGEFRARVQHAANEKRDAAAAKLRKRYTSKTTTLQNRLLRAEQAIQREKQQSNTHTVNAAISFGSAILGAVLGRKSVSSTKVGSAMRKAGSARKQAGDVARAKQTAAKVRADLEALGHQLSAELAEISAKYNAQDEELSEIPVRPKTTDIHVPVIGLTWLPYEKDADGRFVAAWRD
ncbi:MAG: ATP-binding protein [Woeseiaceae bacterium]